MAEIPDLLKRLDVRAQRGSKARCHLLTHGSPEHVAKRLTSLAEPYGHVTPDDKWMPQGFDQTDEAELDRAEALVPHDMRCALGTWWLACHSNRSKTPNWDIAATCTVDGQRGLLLIEAKAHEKELIKEEVGKRFKPPVTANSERNHARIGACIQEASVALSHATKQPWALSRDSRYQLANRFAWSWKLTELGVPVILIYLGFLEADEMSDKGAPFHSPEDWQRAVIAHSRTCVPAEVWGNRLDVNGQVFVPLIRCSSQPLT